MIRLRFALLCALIGYMLAGSVSADDAQRSFARDIEKLSLTFDQEVLDRIDQNPGGFVLYPPLNTVTRRFVTVEGCQIAHQVMRLTDDHREVVDMQIAFDLSQAVLPVEFQDDGRDTFYALGSAAITVSFRPPYMPDLLIGLEPKASTQAVAGFSYIMEPIADAAQPRAFLAAMTQYQREYCLFQG